MLVLFSVLCTLTLTEVVEEDDGAALDDDTDEVILDESVEEAVRQKILVDRVYNSSFTISVPMLTVTVPGSKPGGVVRFSMSHITLWTLVATAFVGLTYPIFLGPHGRLHKRDLNGRGVDPSLLDHLDSLVNVRQIYDDISSLVPAGASKRCWRRALCEAHEREENFGLLGTVMRKFYSPKSLGSSWKKDGLCEQMFGDCVISPADAYREAYEALSSATEAGTANGETAPMSRSESPRKQR